MSTSSNSSEESDFESRLRQAKLDAMKELAYGASHEINNPLANISARAQALLRDETDPERRRTLEAMNSQALRAHEMISDLMLFARPPELVLEKVQVRDIIEQALAESAALASERQVSVRIASGVSGNAESELYLVADRSQLIVAVGTLLRNSIEAASGRSDVAGQVEVITKQVGQAGERRVSMVVTDNGPGFSEAAAEHMFDPFYSGREAGRGHGFGLSKCWRIVTGHGGTVSAENLAAGGARFTIALPC